MRTNKVCMYCGSTHVKRDAWAGWDAEGQRWVLDGMYDNAFCETCEGEATVVTVSEDDVIDCAGCGYDFHNKHLSKTARGDYLCEVCNEKES